jgi:hypothetical protein
MKQYELQKLLDDTEDEKLKSKIIMDHVALSEILLHSVSQGKFMQAIQHDTQALQAYMHTLPEQKESEDMSTLHITSYGCRLIRGNGDLYVCAKVLPNGALLLIDNRLPL